MKKAISLIVSVVLLLIFCSGCSKNTSVSIVEKPTNSLQPEVVKATLVELENFPNGKAVVSKAE